MNFKKSLLGVLLFVVIIFVSYSIVVFIIGPIDKRASPYRGTSWSTVNKPDSIYKTIIRGDIGTVDTLLIVVNEKDSILEAISFSKKIKFLLDTTKDNNRAVLIDPASGKKLRFIIKEKRWWGLYQKAFRKLERF